MYFITIKRMLEVCFSAHPNIQYRAILFKTPSSSCYRFLKTRVRFIWGSLNNLIEFHSEFLVELYFSLIKETQS